MHRSQSLDPQEAKLKAQIRSVNARATVSDAVEGARDELHFYCCDAVFKYSPIPKRRTHCITGRIGLLLAVLLPEPAAVLAAADGGDAERL